MGRAKARPTFFKQPRRMPAELHPMKDEIRVRFPSPHLRQLTNLSGRGVTVARGNVSSFLSSWLHSVNYDGDSPVELHRTRSARQLAPGERKLGRFTPTCRRRIESVANAVGTTCRGFESHQLHFLPMRHLRGCSSAGRAVPFHNSRRHDFGKTAGRRNDERKRTGAECSPGLHLPMSRLGKNSCRLF